MFAIKANRQYEIDESEKQKYIDMGYKIAELKGKKLVFEETEKEDSKEMAELKEKVKDLETELEALKEQVPDNEKEPAKAAKTNGEGK